MVRFRIFPVPKDTVEVLLPSCTSIDVIDLIRVVFFSRDRKVALEDDTTTGKKKYKTYEIKNDDSWEKKP